MKKIAALLVCCLLKTAYLPAQTVNFTSSNLPIVVINTSGQPIADDPKITADMGIIYNGPGQRNQLSDPFNEYNGKIGIETRGHSSQMFPMKSYGLELRDNTGKSVNKAILGMPKESDWVLYAPYTDKTLMRNFLAYTLSRELGQYAARCQFVEVILNGDYIGVYVMLEKIKRNANRVDIAKMDNTNISGDELTGGYIFSIDKDPNAWYSVIPPPNNSQQRVHFSYVTPKPEDITPEQEGYIKRSVDSFEYALFNKPYSDTLNGYRHFIDVQSFMDYFFVNELSRNVDGYRLSSYFHKDRDSRNRRIFAGPVWDYDLAFRNADYCNGSYTYGWAYDFNYVCPGDGAGLVPFWWQQMMKDTAYTAELRCQWKSLRQDLFNEDQIYHLIDSVATLVDEAQQRHFTRWPVLGVYIWPNPSPIPSTYSGEITELKTWLHQRMQWIDQNIPNNGVCSDFRAPSGDGSIIVSANPNPFTSTLTLGIVAKSALDVNLEVYDMTGRLMMARKYQLVQGNNTIPLPSSGWSRGQYVLRVSSSLGDKELRKLIKN